MISTREWLSTGGQRVCRREIKMLSFDFRCSFCHLIFSSSHLLHLHKEDTNHWSDDGFEEETDSEQEEEEKRWGEGDRML